MPKVVSQKAKRARLSTTCTPIEDESKGNLPSFGVASIDNKSAIDFRHQSLTLKKFLWLEINVFLVAY